MPGRLPVPAPTPPPAADSPRHRRGPTPPPPPGTTPGNAPGAPPTMPFEDAIREYQASHPATRASYEGMFDYLRERGYQVERPTHAGGRLPSDDKIVDQRTGRVYDVIVDVHADTGAGRWGLGTSRDWPYWVNGRPSRTAPGAPAGPPGTPAAGAVPPPAGEQAVPRGTFGPPPYPAAYEAARRQRLQAGVGGRRSTILGGFTPGTPRTRPTLLGRG